MSNERFRGYLHILKRVALVTLIMIILDAVGLSVLFYAQGRLEYFSFMESLILLLLLEGCLIGAAGGFMYLGLDVVEAVQRGAHNPAITQEKLKNKKEKRESQRRWAVILITAGLLMIFVGLLISSVAHI